MHTPQAKLCHWLSLLALVFLSAKARPETERNLQALLTKQVTVLLVRGYEPRDGAWLGESFGDWEGVAREWSRLGFGQVRLSRSPPGSSVATGSRIVAAEIEASDQPVLVVGHSMGGLIALEAVLRSTQAARNTAGLLLKQSPIAGSLACEGGKKRLEPERPAVDSHRRLCQAGMALWWANPWLAGWSAFGLAANEGYQQWIDVRTEYLFEKLWGGEAAILDEASTQARRRYLWAHEGAIRHLAQNLALVSVIGYGGENHAKYARMHAKLSAQGHRNDGLVEVASQEYLYRKLGLGRAIFVDIAHSDAIEAPDRHSWVWADGCQELLLAAHDILGR